MFCANDKIHYVGSGVCLIQEITVKRIGRNRASYYVLKPLHQQTSVIYVPVDKEELVARMRPILTRDQVRALIDSIDSITPVWYPDVNERKLQFDGLLRSGSCADLICLIKSLFAQRKIRQAEGKLLHVSDETFLREAQRLLYDEFAGVLEKTPKEIEAELLPLLQASVEGS